MSDYNLRLINSTNPSQDFVLFQGVKSAVQADVAASEVTTQGVTADQSLASKKAADDEGSIFNPQKMKKKRSCQMKPANGGIVLPPKKL